MLKNNNKRFTLEVRELVNNSYNHDGGLCEQKKIIHCSDSAEYIWRKINFYDDKTSRKWVFSYKWKIIDNKTGKTYTEEDLFESMWSFYGFHQKLYS